MITRNGMAHMTKPKSSNLAWLRWLQKFAEDVNPHMGVSEIPKAKCEHQ